MYEVQELSGFWVQGLWVRAFRETGWAVTKEPETERERRYQIVIIIREFGVLKQGSTSCCKRWRSWMVAAPSCVNLLASAIRKSSTSLARKARLSGSTGHPSSWRA